MKLLQRPLLAACLLAGFSISACAQAITEYSLGTARSGVAGAAGGKSMGKSAGAVFDKANKALENAGKAGGAKTAAPAEAPAKAAPAASSVSAAPAEKRAERANTPIDPAAVTTGLDRRDLVSKFGKPSMKMTSMEGSQVVEKYWYMAAGREAVIITLRDGKVAAVSSAAN